MPEIPTKIGRYTVQRTLGYGAMGRVYLADDPLLKRRLAIKVVRAVGEERDLALDRFKREAEISAQLNHPNVVTIYDVGEEPDLGPFLAMEYVEGSSLGKLIRDGNLEVETCLGILIQAMRALRAAHRHAIVHRDVKPDNILVSEDGRVKLMDFGIAKTMAPRMTASGEFLGSPAYSAPELLRGEDPTPSSDRYAFAVTAFELLTGQLPHPGSNVAAVISHVLHEGPVIPPGMSGPVGNVFRRALASDPDDRYETLMQFLLALMDTYPLDDLARGRVEDLFRHDDHAGDIVPLRRTRAPRQVTGSESIGASGSFHARATPVRPTPVYSQTGTMKIELDPDALDNPRTTASHPAKLDHSSEPIRPWVLVAWIVVVWIVGSVFWAVMDYLRHP
ncbi:serine/threonine-protein kinase [Holophaga foetida]|uniref:serine/threonine-protein kinase n=1 Tax=Holophaga foetida TaxID=35839 RepID=UPI0002471D06|nr:serine/threonine-protein kinase [Holophaga foetida]